MQKQLDLYDIQGNVCKGYGRYGFPKARYCFLNFSQFTVARQFLLQLINKITSAEPWPMSDSGDLLTDPNKQKPYSTFNIAFTYGGLAALKLPQRSLKSFPLDFTMGMKARAELLGDTGVSSPEHWDEIWQAGNVHAWVAINGRDQDALACKFDTLMDLIAEYSDGVHLLSGHKGPNGSILPYQDASAVFENGQPSAKEHFGFTDGISNPHFAGCGEDDSRMIGRGKLMRDGGWQPLATGEFILGHIDEAQEYPSAPEPKLLARNGSFMVYRKLHQNIDAFAHYIDNLARDFDGSRDLLMAKLSGRWPDNGAPLVLAATDDEKAALDAQMTSLKLRIADGDISAIKEQALMQQKWVDFTFNQDKEGGRCPMGAHIRRTNPRGSLETESGAYQTPGALVNRRRMMRRGLPYGGVDESKSDAGEQGIIFMAVVASLERQFEFVQQQWVNYANDFKLGNDKDPLIGAHEGLLSDKHIIQTNGEVKPPFFCAQLPRFVETRGGDYFFIPSITALRMLAQGIIDPS